MKIKGLRDFITEAESAVPSLPSAANSNVPTRTKAASSYPMANNQNKGGSVPSDRVRNTLPQQNNQGSNSQSGQQNQSNQEDQNKVVNDVTLKDTRDYLYFKLGSDKDEIESKLKKKIKAGLRVTVDDEEVKNLAKKYDLLDERGQFKDVGALEKALDEFKRSDRPIKSEFGSLLSDILDSKLEKALENDPEYKRIKENAKDMKQRHPKPEVYNKVVDSIEKAINNIYAKNDDSGVALKRIETLELAIKHDYDLKSPANMAEVEKITKLASKIFKEKTPGEGTTYVKRFTNWLGSRKIPGLS